MSTLIICQSSYLHGFRISFSTAGLDILNIIYLLVTTKNLQKTPNCKHLENEKEASDFLMYKTELLNTIHHYRDE